MRKTVIFAFLTIFLMTLGCAKTATMPEEPAPIDIPEMTQVEAEKETPAEEPSAPEEKPAGTIGSRVTGNEPAVEEQETPEGTTEVLLLPDKTMNTASLTVKAGDTVTFRNTDTWPHQIKIEQENPNPPTAWEKMTLVQDGERMEAGEIWTYTFNDKGVFLARDIFSGDMRMDVTVE